MQNSNRTKRAFHGTAYAVFAFLLCSLWAGWAFPTKPIAGVRAAVQAPPPTPHPKGKKIILRHADLLSYDAAALPDVQRLVGNVFLEHDHWLMHCDSAYLNDKTNFFTAYGHVHITEGDSIVIDADYLEYDGENKMAMLTGNAQLSKRETTLNTETLYYDRNLNLAYYMDGGVIADSLNVLTSEYAEHEVSTGNTLFESDVVLTHPDFILTTEQLRYNTNTKICNIVDSTHIVSDSTTIETARGTYDTERDLAILLDRSLVTDPQGTFTGDSIFYDKPAQIGQAYGDVYMDNIQDKVIFRGDYGYLDRNNNYTFATQRAYATDYSRTDSLYLAADTLEGINYTTGPNAPYKGEEVRYLRGYYHARLYRKDMQAVGDSVNYFSPDSMLSLHGSPVLWQDSTQLQGNLILAFFSGDTLESSQALGNASSVQAIRDGNFNKVKSDSITAFFADSTLSRALYSGNVESVYYLDQEKIKHYYGISRIKSPNMDVYIAGDTLQRIHWDGAATGNIYPIETLTPEQSELSGVQWITQGRPSSPQDIFVAIATDSLGNALYPGKLSLAQLAAFDGLAAWQIFEPQFRTIIEADSLKRIAPLPAATGADGESTPEPLPPFIARPTDAQPLPPFNPQDLIFVQPWHYFLSDPEDPKASATNPFTGIPKRMS